MEIRILHQLEGAKQASGLTVVIDVFRAFSLECYMYLAGADMILPTGTIEDAVALKKNNPSYILCGERNGVKVPGFDFGNSPSAFEDLDLHGKTVIHTTSAGVQGLLAAAKSADEIITGSLVNASAVASYIHMRDPDVVSIVAMGYNGVRNTEEDELCAEYIRSLLVGNPMADIDKRALALKEQEGKKFFDPAQQEVFPERDFWLCIRHDTFSGVIRVNQTDAHLTTTCIYV